MNQKTLVLQKFRTTYQAIAAINALKAEFGSNRFGLQIGNTEDPRVRITIFEGDDAVATYQQALRMFQAGVDYALDEVARAVLP
jgi:hypothetical protein